MRIVAFVLLGASPALPACDRGHLGERPTSAQPAKTPSELSHTEQVKVLCENGDGAKCWLLGASFEKGMSDEYGYYPQDFGAAATYYQRGCQLGDLGACTDLGRLLKDGKGVPRDERRAASLFVDACQRGHGFACLWAGIACASGKGVDLDVDRATDFYRKACTAGVESGCDALTRLSTLTLGTGKHATVPSPAGGGGFRLGAPLQEAETTCRGAGFNWLVAVDDPTQGRCTGVPGKVGLDFAYFGSCPSGKVCAIDLGRTLDPRNPNQWLSEYRAKAAVLETRYGTPSARQYQVPKECYSTFALCLVDKRAKVIAVWTWEGGEVVVIHLQISQNQPTIWVSYATGESTRSNVNSL